MFKLPLLVPPATVQITEIIPVTKGLVFNQAVGAGVDMFATALSPTNSPTTFRIYACFDTLGVLTMRRTRAGATVSEQLNSGTALNANAAYIFDIIVQAGETLNLRHSAGAQILYLKVVEVAGVIS